MPLTLTPPVELYRVTESLCQSSSSIPCSFLQILFEIPSTSPIAVYIKHSGLFPNPDHLGTVDLHLRLAKKLLNSYTFYSLAFIINSPLSSFSVGSKVELRLPLPSVLVSSITVLHPAWPFLEAPCAQTSQA